MNKRVVAVLLAGVMAVSTLTACGSQKTEETAAPEEPQVENDGQETSDSAYPMTFDNYGREVTITQKPQKVLTLGPNCTELFAALGLGDYVVGRSLVNHSRGPLPEFPVIQFFHFSVHTICHNTAPPDSGHESQTVPSHSVS